MNLIELSYEERIILAKRRFEMFTSDYPEFFCTTEDLEYLKTDIAIEFDVDSKDIVMIK